MKKYTSYFSLHIVVVCSLLICTNALAQRDTPLLNCCPEDNNYPVCNYIFKGAQDDTDPCNQLEAFININGESAEGNDGSISISPFGGLFPYDILWSTGATTNNIDMLSAGEYSVLVKDAEDCNKTFEGLTVSEYEPLSSYIEFGNQSFPGANNGFATVHPIGGNPFYSSAWSTGNFGSSQFGLTAGTYYVTVTDGSGNTHVNDVEIGTNDLSIDIINTDFNACNFSGWNTTAEGNTAFWQIISDLEGYSINGSCFAYVEPLAIDQIYLNAPMVDASTYDAVYMNFDGNFNTAGLNTTLRAILYGPTTDFTPIPYMEMTFDDCGEWVCGPPYPSQMVELIPFTNFF